MIRALILIALVALPACGSSANECSPQASCYVKPKVTVFAAASLQPAFDKIAERLHFSATFNYAGTQTLTSQLTQGAQADVFASADTAHMTTLQHAGLIQDAPQVFAHNRLEIAVANGARGGLVVVLADPSVPAGQYAQQALAKAGVTVKPASLELQVTAVLSKVAVGEADAGIVYVSDVVTSGKVDGVAIPDSQNVIAAYPIATLKDAQNKGAATDFIGFVLSPDGQSILKAAGFESA